MEKRRDAVEMELFRSHLNAMSDAELSRLADTLAKICSRGTTGGQTVKEIAQVNLEEAKTEWKRRHPPTDS
jgi:hypothetical protein